MCMYKIYSYFKDKPLPWIVQDVMRTILWLSSKHWEEIAIEEMFGK